MKRIDAAVNEMELYEFDYALHDLVPEDGWDSIALDPKEEIERLISSRDFYAGIQTKPRIGEKLVLDEQIIRLTRMLFVGLVKGQYPEAWVKALFFF